jgi:hypothetical protein
MDVKTRAGPCENRRVSTSSAVDVSLDLEVLQDAGRSILTAAASTSKVAHLRDVREDALACPEAVAALNQLQLEQRLRAEIATDALRSAGRRPGTAANAIAGLDAGMVKAV